MSEDFDIEVSKNSSLYMYIRSSLIFINDITMFIVIYMVVFLVTLEFDFCLARLIKPNLYINRID